MDEVKVVVAHSERATLRVGDVFLKVDADQARIDVEVEAMSLAPVPTPVVLWRKPPVLAIAALPGTTLGRLGGPSTGSPAAWAAAGAAIRKLHEAPLFFNLCIDHPREPPGTDKRCGLGCLLLGTVAAMATVEAPGWMVQRAGTADVAGLAQVPRRTASVADEPEMTKRLSR